jgi:predicted transcriptional regulator
MAGGEDYAEMANEPVRHFMRPPFPVVDESESAGILKMPPLHRQGVLARNGGKVGGNVTWAGVLASWSSCNGLCAPHNSQHS